VAGGGGGNIEEDSMMKTNYYMHELIEKYYRVWINGPTLMEHSLDRDRFYRFVKACIRYSKHWNAKQDIHGSWLRYFLERDLPKRYTNKQFREKIIREIVILFEDILDFNKTLFPDHILEMRDPYSVMGQLRMQAHIDKDSNRRPIYSDNEIEKILADNFGPSWREGYQRKHKRY
jgi:hypothetical protein